ncbi:hypothetical protein ABI59_15780 [Acidobacteria bacterium Mor1]|nr:hypothetical protein ABI59_15780 [Acidobacteria bacterium Mor1]
METNGSKTRKPLWRRLLLIVGLLLVVALVALFLLGRSIDRKIDASLATLDGEVSIPGLSAPVTIERDALGIPTVRAQSWNDLIRAQGFLHAQDRYFQMDLQRRSGGGELAEVIAAAVGRDRRARFHRFRTRAEELVRIGSPSAKRTLSAYTEGVNSGLESLGAPPPEYVALRQDPAPWSHEDATLVLASMFFVLQDDYGVEERRYSLVREAVGQELFDFVTPKGTRFDAAIDGTMFDPVPTPTAEQVDIRSMQPWQDWFEEQKAEEEEKVAFLDSEHDEFAIHLGSNSWAVAGSHSASGEAIVANDMHLGLDVPHIWYRMVLIWPDEETGEERRAVGVTLPGTPGLVAGSNGDITWGFTNSYGDWVDVIELELDPQNPERYLTPDGYREFETYTEEIKLAGGESEALEIRETIWGPVIPEPEQDEDAEEDENPEPLMAVKWVAHDLEAINLRSLDLLKKRTLEEAMTQANLCGIPAQNFVVADRSGRIGWTIMGRIPRREGHDGRFRGSWADGTRRWNGFLEPSEYPRVVDPESGYLWTANARIIGGEPAEVLGNQGFALGARQLQIRDDLLALESPDEGAILEVGLDDRALFLEWWKELLLATLEAGESTEGRDELARVLRENWTGRASIDSAAYRLVRFFRIRTAVAVMEPLVGPAEIGALFHSQYEEPVRRLIEERPLHLLHPDFENWDALLLDVIDKVIEEVREDGDTLAGLTWGKRNTLAMTHHFSGQVPQQLLDWLKLDLDMPAEPLPGDSHMPRVQGASSGASERFAITPGREDRALFHMPGGQSGHPRSPFYRTDHQAWVDGARSPLLPGATLHTLTLVPKE